MQIFKCFNWSSLTVLSILAVFCLVPSAAKAQYQLQIGETKPIYSLTSSDLIIPGGIDTLTLTLKGGDGGDARLNGATCNTQVKGGAGAIVTASFTVGTEAGQLQAGGRLRVFVGSTGNTDYKLCTGDGVHGGGGGSSAVLYLPPNAGNNVWAVLAMAGAGGGGSRPIAGVFHPGKGGNGGNQGDATDYVRSSQSYDGDCGDCDGVFDRDMDGAGGAGTACQTGPKYTGGGYNMTLELWNGVGTLLVPKTSEQAYNTGGTEKGHPPGGNGFTGGGAGYFGGGGGGGYSGGGARTTKNGGGGGSFVSSRYELLHSQRIDGVDGAGSQSNGYVTISAKMGPSCLPTETSYTKAQGRTLLQSGNFVLTWHNNGNLVLKEGDGAGNWTVNWASNTANEGNELKFQPDGNLVIYSSTRLPLWSSDTWENKITGQNGGHCLHLSPQGVLSIFDIDGTMLWSVNKNTEVGQ